MSPSEPPRESQTPWSRYAGMGFEFAAAIGAFMLMGWWVDRHWGIEGRKGLLIGTLIGVIGGTYNFIREAVGALRESERQGRKKRP